MYHMDLLPSLKETGIPGQFWNKFCEIWWNLDKELGNYDWKFESKKKFRKHFVNQ